MKKEMRNLVMISIFRGRFACKVLTHSGDAFVGMKRSGSQLYFSVFNPAMGRCDLTFGGRTWSWCGSDTSAHPRRKLGRVGVRTAL